MTDHVLGNGNGGRRPGAATAAPRGGVTPRPDLDLLVVGGGVSGLAAAREALLRRPEWSVAVIEAEDRAGGTMRSDRAAGCLCEWGPNGFLTNVPDTWDLAVDLGLAERLLPAHPNAEKRLLWVKGGLKPLPMKPGAFFRSDLLSVRGRLRVLLEPFMPKRSAAGDESVYSFASRRIGPEAASVLVDAMVSGIYAGDPENLSLEAAFPKMAAMEARYGSLVRAMIALMRERKKARRATPAAGGGPMGPGGALTSFDEGMEVLIRRLAEILGSRLFTGTRVTGLTPIADGYRVDLESRGGARSVSARNVVMAVPSHVAAAILKDAAPRLAWRLDEIPYAGITVACLIYPRSHVAHPLDGFGFLVPRGQGPRILGCIWTGSIFPPHVHGDHVLLRAMVGGARDPEGAILSEGRTVDLVHGELDRMLGGIKNRPAEVRLYRHAKGIPQYVLGHPERLRAIGEDLAALPGLHLAGNAYRGIGVNDCVREARELAERLTAAGSPAVEGRKPSEARP